MRTHQTVKQRHLDELDAFAELHGGQVEAVRRLLRWKDTVIDVLPPTAATVLTVLCSQLYLGTMKQSPLVKSLQLARKARARGRLPSTVEQPEVEGDEEDDLQLQSIRNAVVGTEENSLRSMMRMLLWTRLAAKLKHQVAMQSQIRERVKMAKEIEQAAVQMEEAVGKMRILTEAKLSKTRTGAFSIKDAEDVLRHKAAMSRRRLQAKSTQLELDSSGGDAGAALHPFSARHRSQHRDVSLKTKVPMEDVPERDTDDAPLAAPLTEAGCRSEDDSSSVVSNSVASSSDGERGNVGALSKDQGSGGPCDSPRAPPAMHGDSTQTAAVMTLRLGTPPGPLQPLHHSSASRRASQQEQDQGALPLGSRGRLDSPQRVTLPPIASGEEAEMERPNTGSTEMGSGSEPSRRNIPSAASIRSQEADDLLQGKESSVSIIHDWHTDILLDTEAQACAGDTAVSAPLHRQSNGVSGASNAQLPFEEMAEHVGEATDVSAVPPPPLQAVTENIWESPEAARRAALRVLSNVTASTSSTSTPVKATPASGAGAGATGNGQSGGDKPVPWWAQGGAKPPPGLQQKVLQDAMAKTTASKVEIERLSQPKSRFGSKDGTVGGRTPPVGGPKSKSKSSESSEEQVIQAPSFPPTHGPGSPHAAVSKPPTAHSTKTGSSGSERRLKNKISGSGGPRKELPLDGWQVDPKRVEPLGGGKW